MFAEKFVDSSRLYSLIKGQKIEPKNLGNNGRWFGAMTLEDVKTICRENLVDIRNVTVKIKILLRIKAGTICQKWEILIVFGRDIIVKRCC